MKIKKSSPPRILLFLLLSTLLSLTLFTTTQPFASVSAPSKPTSFYGTAVKTKAHFTWAKVNNVSGYTLYQYNTTSNSYLPLGSTSSTKYIVKNLTRGSNYAFRVKSYKLSGGKKIYSKYSKKVTLTISTSGYTTLKNFLQTAMEPVGSTMYIWGGGWNQADTGAGTDATRIGLNPNWKSFFSNQTSSYNYKNTKYQWGNGLDCSGYVGWSIYNIMNTSNNKTGYVMKASQMAKTFASKGFGTYRSPSSITNYQAGDIMSSTGSYSHVWIVVGSCSDGSVVLVHSSPPGVSICGTPTKSGNTNSQAVALAKKYMKTYFPKWYNKYPNCLKGSSYLTDYGQMRWNTSGSKILTDPNGYKSMTAKQILDDLF